MIQGGAQRAAVGPHGERKRLGPVDVFCFGGDDVALWIHSQQVIAGGECFDGHISSGSSDRCSCGEAAPALVVHQDSLGQKSVRFTHLQIEDQGLLSQYCSALHRALLKPSVFPVPDDVSRLQKAYPSESAVPKCHWMFPGGHQWAVVGLIRHRVFLLTKMPSTGTVPEIPFRPR